MYYSDLRKYDSQNGFGLGIGVTLFVSGCNFHCKGCLIKKHGISIMENLLQKM